MEYMEFLGRIRDLLNERYSDVTVNVHSTVKNNGVVLSGLSFSKKGYNASPTIYMENYYSDYVEGEDVADIADRIMSLYRENDMAAQVDMSFFDDFEHVKDRLFIKLINKEKNSDFLKGSPYEDFLDLAIVPYVRVCDKKIGNGIIMVRNEHLALWKTDAKKVLAAAKKNTHDHDGYNIRHIMDVLDGLGVGDKEGLGEKEFPMYVATNSRKINGAAVLTMNDKLKEFSAIIGGDYYIIPSSVHELILLGKRDDSACNIDEMIRDVNRTELGPDDVLADHAYVYVQSDEVLIF